MRTERDTAAMNDQTTIRWVWAIALLVMLNAGWMSFTTWYLHGADRWVLFGCEDGSGHDPEEGGLLYVTTAPCPPDRPYANVVRWVVPIAGLLISAAVPPVVVGLSMDRSTGSGRGNLVAWIGLCLFAPALVAIAILVALHAGAIL